MKKVLTVLGLIALSASAAANSLQVKVASLDAGTLVAENSPQAQRAAAALKAASQRCTVQGQRLADQAVVTAQEVAKQGRPASIVEILEGLDAALANAPAPRDCATVLTAYTSLRRDGHSHSHAVVMLRSVDKAITAQK